MYRLLLLLLALAMSAPLAQAQSQAPSNALTTALDHLRASRATLGLSQADLSDVAVTDEYVSRASGATHLYLRQKVNGVEVYNGHLNALVTPDGRVVGVNSRFVSNASRSANDATPSISVEAAVEAAAQHLGLVLADAPSVVEPANERNQLVLSDAGVSLSPIPAQLVYFIQEDGTLRLAWDLSIEQLDAEHWWSLRVDAETGVVLDQNDWVVHDEWVAENAAANYRPVAASPMVGARSGGASYNVWAYPVESPSHGERSLAVAPEDATASPLGWHDDNNSQYTITRGNNVHAYEDRAASNLPGYSPDGGDGLVFDFDVDFETQTPVDYEDVAITNLFYWNNVIHDVLYHHGFDEVAGNFQSDNFGNGGALTPDYVRAEAQDGTGTNNANFATPPDGSRPRMQMFQWTGGIPVTITSPESIAGSYQSGFADFGDPWASDFPATEIVPAETFDGGDYPGGEEDLDLADRACEEFFNADDVAGKIALVERGDCAFALKVWNAQLAGAVGVIIHNNSRNGAGETGTPEDVTGMTHTPSDLPFDINDLVIPSAFVAQSTGQLIFNNTPAFGFSRSALNRDSDLDAGVIVHEYGHGISNRLTGGPQAAGCLTGDEQMGEGWSDWYGLMLTMNEGDQGDTGRGIGTYLQYEDVDGPGIRTYRYSTDLAVNPHTYNDIRSEVIPHGVGSVWSAMLWEMTWGLIGEEGFDADLINGTGGNNIAMTLVTEGMKIQPCGPGFVDGRDGILMADTLLYEGAYSDIIWTAFAKRGLGYSADQGSSASRLDGTEAFDMPPMDPVANEGDALPNGYAISAAYPNPFEARTQFTLEVAETQDVTVAVYDVMGRMVSALHEGPLAAGSRHVFAVEGASFASGVYLVRVTGEQFAETRRVTLLR